MSRLPRAGRILVVTLLTLATIFTIGYVASKLSERNAWQALRESNSLRFSPDYRVIAADTFPYEVSLWDTSGKRLLHSLGEASLATQLVFAPDGDTFVWSNQDYAFFYSFRLDRMVSTPVRARSWIYAMAISPARSEFSQTDILATGGRVSKDGTSAIELWNRHHANHANYTVAEFNNGVDVFSLGFSEDGSLLAAGLSDGTFHVWQVSTDKLQEQFQARQVLTSTTSYESVSSLAISSDNQTIAVSDMSGHISLLRLQDGRLLNELVTQQGIGFLAFSRDSKLLAGGQSSPNGPDDSTVSVWRVSDGREQWLSRPHPGLVADLRFSSDSKGLTVGYSDATVQTYTLP